MKNDIMKKRLIDSLGKEIKIVLKSNGWKYAGKLINVDESYIELLDYVVNGFKVVAISDVNNLEVKE